MTGSITRSQLNFLKKLIKNNINLERKVDDFLSKKNVSSLNDLKSDDASELIEEIKKASESKIGRPLTKKQREFIENLNTSPERMEITMKYLRNIKKGSVEELTLDEASNLIEELKKVNVETGRVLKMISQKQLKYLKSLAEDSKKLEISIKFLKERNKSGFEELTSKEASELIDLLLI
ncbi:hypothetical protein [Caldiplasma sukawensis]